MAALFPFAFMAVAVSIGFLTSNVQKQKQADNWRRVADDLGLFFAPGSGFAYGQLSGRLRGVEILVDVHARGSGDSKAQYTRYRLNYPSLADGSFLLTKQRAFSIFGRMLGRRDVQIGDPSFDSRVVIDSADPTVVDRYLSPARRMAVLTLMEGNDFVEVGPRSISVERRGIEKEALQLRSMINYMVDIALVLSAPSDVDLALGKQERGDLADAVDALHVINDVQDSVPNSFTQFLEAEALVAMGEGEKASQILDDMPVFDAELGEWKTVAQNHAQPLKLEPIPPPPLNSAPTTPDTASPIVSRRPVDIPLDQQSVIDDLFGSERLSFEVEQRFFDVYESAHVIWSGTVQRSRVFQRDRDFPGTGVKATVEIGSRGASKLVSNRVHAIVHFPEDTTLSTGDEVRFSGTLVRADRYMRNLFVSNAKAIAV